MIKKIEEYRDALNELETKYLRVIEKYNKLQEVVRKQTQTIQKLKNK